MELKHLELTELASRKRLEASIFREFLTVKEIGFHGVFCRSENGRFIVAWSDPGPSTQEEAAHKTKQGRYILIDTTFLAVQGILERPNDGRVSDSGTFILNDWMSGPGLCGTFYVFDSGGNLLISREFGANLCKNMISRDGRFAVCQTLHSENVDGDRIFFFDIGSREVLWGLKPRPGRAKDFDIDVENKVLYLIYEDNHMYRYDFAGQFLDLTAWEIDLYESANGYVLLNYALEKKKLLGAHLADNSVSDNLILLLRKALERGVTPYYQGMIHKELGDAYRGQGNKVEAVSNYEKALSLNPKVGVRRMLNALKQKSAKIM